MTQLTDEEVEIIMVNLGFKHWDKVKAGNPFAEVNGKNYFRLECEKIIKETAKLISEKKDAEINAIMKTSKNCNHDGCCAVELIKETKKRLKL